MTRSGLLLSVAALASTVALGGAAAAQTPMTKMDQEWVSVTGPISNVNAEGFRIDYGAGELPVEWDGILPTSTHGLRNGDWVHVSGRIDDSLWERRSIEGWSLYSSRLQERFWANSADEEGDYSSFALIDLPDQGEWLGMTGEVVSVDPAEHEMVIDTGARNMQVDTTDMGVPVLATRGDHVSVYGQLDDADLWDGREIDASSVVILNQASS